MYLKQLKVVKMVIIWSQGHFEIVKTIFTHINTKNAVEIVFN